MYTPSIRSLIEELGKLPGIGPRSAQRIAFYLLRSETNDVYRLADAIKSAKDNAMFCETCFNFSEGVMCSICSDQTRDRSIICVVEEPKDVVALERSREYKGLYHVLQGALSPIDGIGPDKIKVRELLVRLADKTITEVILCTNPNIEGEATAMYLARQLQDTGLTVTRIASGLPVGGDLDYADELTIGRALQGRRQV
ncbi:MAG: recombination protein RecR [Acidimicrobiaceae bacterium]|nr:recombination protein RecR [Acidimicrobiaceae bacterium]